MIALLSSDALSSTDIILLLGILGVLFKSIAEGQGWLRSASQLRTENMDLIRRNTELVEDRTRLELKLTEQGEKIARLEEQVKTLQSNDQSAVLKAIEAHEVGADSRFQSTQSVLERIASAIERGVEH